MPKVIYMTHALRSERKCPFFHPFLDFTFLFSSFLPFFLSSLYLVKLGLAPRLQKKKYKFTDEELALASEKLGDIALPAFGDLAAQLDKETGGSKQSEIDALQQDYEGKFSKIKEIPAKKKEKKTCKISIPTFHSPNSQPRPVL